MTEATAEQVITSSLVLGKPLPPMTKDIKYEMRGYRNATVAWNTVPSHLRDLDADQWRNRAYLKQTFQNKGKMLDGPAFPICLLLNCNTIEDRLKVMSWWNHLGNFRKDEWKEILSKFATPTKSGKLLALSGQISTAKLPSKLTADARHPEQRNQQAGKRPNPASTAASKVARMSAKATVLDLNISQKVVIITMQEIYRQHCEKGGEESMLREHKGFRNGIILLRSSFECFDRIPLLDNQKVLLVCKQSTPNNEQCEQFSTYNRLGLRWNTIALCKSCREKQKESDDAKTHSETKQAKLQEKYKALQSVVQKQQKRIKRLEESLSSEKQRNLEETDRLQQMWRDHNQRRRLQQPTR